MMLLVAILSACQTSGALQSKMNREKERYRETHEHVDYIYAEREGGIERGTHIDM